MSTLSSALSDAAEFAAIASAKPFAIAAVALARVSNSKSSSSTVAGAAPAAPGASSRTSLVAVAAFERRRAAFEHLGKLGIESLLHVVLDHNRVDGLSGVRGRSKRHIHMERAAHPVSEIAIERLFVDARMFERRSQIRLTGSGISSAIATMPI